MTETPSNPSAEEPLPAKTFEELQEEFDKLRERIDLALSKTPKALEDLKTKEEQAAKDLVARAMATAAFRASLPNIITVTEVVGINRIDFTTADGRQAHPSIEGNAHAFDYLLNLYMKLGTGEHKSHMAQDVFYPNFIAPRTLAGVLTSVMPQEVFDVGKDPDLGLPVFKFGNIALASRKPTPADLEQHKEYLKREERAEFDRTLEAIDWGKVNLTTHDHATLIVRGRNDQDHSFYLPLDRANGFLAARVLRALQIAGGQPGVNHVEGKPLAAAVWDMMPVAERLLFAPKEKDLIRKTGIGVIDRHVLQILRQLTNRLGVTRETTGERFKLEGRATIGFNMTPPESIDLTKTTPFFPPGTEIEKIYEFVGDTIPNEAMAAAGSILDLHLNSSDPLGHKEALKLLDFITNRTNKRAIGAILKTRAPCLAVMHWTNFTAVLSKASQRHIEMRALSAQSPVTTP